MLNYRVTDIGPDATASEKARARRDVALATAIGLKLEHEYPGHIFGVKVDSYGGVAKINHPLIPQCFGYIIKLRDLSADPGMKCVLTAGGELLERFYLDRGKRKPDLWREASQKYHRTKMGVVTERNWRTGERRLVLPTELSR